jgi:hypothetical protein
MIDAIFEAFAANDAQIPDPHISVHPNQRAKDAAMREMKRTRRHTLTAQELVGG